MENPYWKADPKPHYLDREGARTQCFHLFNIISASQSLAGEMEAAEVEGDQSGASSLYKLHHQIAEPTLSQLLLGLAVFVRTFDDVMSDSEMAEAYKKHAEATSGRDYIGELDGGSIDLRQACNKIIHARDVSPLYEEAGGSHEAWYMTGEVELGGTLGATHWHAVLDVQHFLEIVLDRIAFGE